MYEDKKKEKLRYKQFYLIRTSMYTEAIPTYRQWLITVNAIKMTQFIFVFIEIDEKIGK